MALRICFAGTPEFAIPALETLLQSEHEVCAVYTQPDRPAGRGRHLTASPVKQLALAHNIAVYQPLSLRTAEIQEDLKALQMDVMVVVAYGLLLPQVVLDLPKMGCINIHGSLLPRWRGAAPIQRAILAGDQKTGITIMQMEAGLDTGPMLKQAICPIAAHDTSKSLYDSLAVLGADLLLETLRDIENQTCKAVPQSEADVTYAAKLTKEEAHLDWSQPAEVLERQVRGFNPWPIAFSQLEGQPLRIWQAQAVAASHAYTPGTIITTSKAGIEVAAANGILRLLQIQLPGGKVVTAQEFLNAHRQLLTPGLTRLT